MLCQEFFNKIVEIIRIIKVLPWEYVNIAKSIASSDKFPDYKYAALGFNIIDNNSATLHEWTIRLQGYKQHRQTGNIIPLVNSFMPPGKVRTYYEWEEELNKVLDYYEWEEELNKVLDSALCGYLNEHKDEVLEYMQDKLIDYLNKENNMSMKEINRNKEIIEDLKNSI